MSMQMMPRRWPGETLINGSSFQSRAALESEWNYLYPWGSDHNGTARMYASSTDSNHLFLSPAGQLNIKASRISWDEGVVGRETMFTAGGFAPGETVSVELRSRGS